MLKIRGTNGNALLSGLPVIDTIKIYDTSLTNENPPTRVEDPATGTLLTTYAISGYASPSGGQMAVSGLPENSSTVAATGKASYFRGFVSGVAKMQGLIGPAGTPDSAGRPFDLTVDGSTFNLGETEILGNMVFVSLNNDG